MIRYSITTALVIALATTSQCQATTLPTPGPVPLDEGLAYYYIQTGEITVSVNNISVWYVESESSSLTGDPPANLPAASVPSLVGDYDQRIAESSFQQFTYTDVELGPVAEPFLPEGNLTMMGYSTLSEPVQTWPVVYISIPEPTSLALGDLGLCAALAFRSMKRRPLA